VPEDDVKVQQQRAYSTYKDDNLPAPHRFDLALDILKQFCDLENTTNTETLGLAGAIYKRLWEYTGRREDLERALHFYEYGHDLKADDDGWVSLNAAFVLDLIAQQELKSGGSTAVAGAKEHVEKADAIRTEVQSRLKAQGSAHGKPAWWYHASLAEAAVGLRDLAAAEAALANYLAMNPPPRDQESTARQLSALIRIRYTDSAAYADAVAMLARAFNISDVAVRALVAGKIGLALSGGGFRASLYHIGVLAKLAELDLLRYVEVISCVSGGSILGAFYYLELKKRLERGSVSRADYIQIVRDVEKKFVAGVQKNIRTRVAANPLAGVKMALKAGYSRTDRIGMLYESYLYDQVPDEGQKPARVMADLRATLPGYTDFNPRTENWRLDAKVPQLVLNATTLNTGHTWQFTATYMGESPQSISTNIDTIPRLRRRYYAEPNFKEPKDVKDVPLGHGVAASAGVPGLFEPLALSEYYDDRLVRLVDGGVHDNQGLGSLIELGCRVILVSDASGQMREELSPKGEIGAVVGRSSSISQARVREAQFDQLQTMVRSGAIEGSMFIHLTKELDAEPVGWVGAPAEPPSPPRSETTTYGVDRDIQLALSKIRTDLDSFSDAEAYGLMASGYAMANQALVEQQCAPTLPINDAREEWSFLRVWPALAKENEAENKRMKDLLKASPELTFRIWRQLQALKVLAVVLGIAALGSLVELVVKTWHASITLLTWGQLIATAAVVVFVTWALCKLLKKRPGEIAIGIALATVGFAGAWIHLLLFDKLFLRHGRWEEKPMRFVGPGPKLPIKGGDKSSSVGATATPPPRTNGPTDQRTNAR